jgi:hypothetical protein
MAGRVALVALVALAARAHRAREAMARVVQRAAQVGRRLAEASSATIYSDLFLRAITQGILLLTAAPEGLQETAVAAVSAERTQLAAREHRLVRAALVARQAPEVSRVRALESSNRLRTQQEMSRRLLAQRRRAVRVARAELPREHL